MSKFALFAETAAPAPAAQVKLQTPFVLGVALWALLAGFVAYVILVL